MPSRTRFFAIALTSLLLTAARALGTDVVIVRASDDEPFKQAEAALRKQLEDQPYTVNSMPAREASDQGIDSSIGRPDMVVAIGTAAAKWLHKQLPRRGETDPLHRCRQPLSHRVGVTDDGADRSNTTAADQIGVEIPDSLSHRATFVHPEK